MNFNNPIPRSGLPRFHEASALGSPRDSDVTPRLWLKARTTTNQLGAYGRNLFQVQRRLATLRLYKPGVVLPGVSRHPFKIYRSPANPDWSPDERTSRNPAVNKAWRSFRVRAGKVGDKDVIGTDGGTGGVPTGSPPAQWGRDSNYWPDGGWTPGWDNGIDFVVPSGEKWFVWIDCTDLNEPEINAAKDPPTEGFWTGRYILIGTIDCATYRAQLRALVRQLRRSDVVLAQQCINNEVKAWPI